MQLNTDCLVRCVHVFSFSQNFFLLKVLLPFKLKLIQKDMEVSLFKADLVQVNPISNRNVLTLLPLSKQKKKVMDMNS